MESPKTITPLKKNCSHPLAVSMFGYPDGRRLRKVGTRYPCRRRKWIVSITTSQPSCRCCRAVSQRRPIWRSTKAHRRIMAFLRNALQVNDLTLYGVVSTAARFGGSTKHPGDWAFISCGYGASYGAVRRQSLGRWSNAATALLRSERSKEPLD